MTDDIGFDLTLANGLNYSLETLDLKVLMNMKNIPRGYLFTGVPAHDNFTLADHSLLSYLIASKYWDYLEKNRDNEILAIFPKSLVDKWGTTVKQLTKSYFCDRCLTHDFGEVVTGDLVPSFKTEEYRAKESKVAEDIMSYLGKTNIHSLENVLKKHIKIVDIIASMWEIKQLIDKGYKEVFRIYDVRKEILDKFDPDKNTDDFLEEICA